MKRPLKLLGTALIPAFIAGSAHAASLTVNCQEIAQYSQSEVNFIYYKVEESDGAAEASRLWGAYHGLRGRCVHHPHARATVNVSPELAEEAQALR